MEAKNADLSTLRIKRTDDSPHGRGKFGLAAKIALGGVLLIALVAVYLVLRGAFESAVEVKLVAATYSSPSQANAVLTASGYVVAQRKAAVASKATGRLVYLRVVEGDRVKKGEMIAQIEDADVKASLAQAKATLALNHAELKDAERTLERQQELLSKGLTSQAEFDAAQARYQRVVASIDVAKAAIDAAEVALENTRIRAPFDGTVLTKNADVGEMVAPMAASVSSRSAVVTIADMRSLEVEADVSESNIERIRENQPCEITLDAYPDTRYQGYVTKIVPTADRAKATVLVKVGFRSYDSRVLPEMSAKVLFLTKQSEASSPTTKPLLTIPASAVVTRDGRSVVFTVEDNKAVEIPVTTGASLGAIVEVKEGIESGTRVIANVNDRIVNGVKVKVQ